MNLPINQPESRPDTFEPEESNQQPDIGLETEAFDGEMDNQSGESVDGSSEVETIEGESSDQSAEISRSMLPAQEESAEIEPEAMDSIKHSGPEMGDLLRHLRNRSFRQHSPYQPDPDAHQSYDSDEDTAELVESAGPESEELSAFAPEEMYECDHYSDELTEEDDEEFGTYKDVGELAEKTDQMSVAIEDLSQEIRRVGRELFKTNRTADRNQEMFEAALEDLRRLSDIVARIPEQHAESVAETVFEIKAPLCREMLRVVDALEASLTSAQEILVRLQKNAEQPATGFKFWSRPDERLRLALKDSVSALSEWLDGQKLLRERLMTALNSVGVRQIETEGRPFNPELHRAVSVRRQSGLPAGTITGVESKGYTLDGKILRYAEVIVARDG